MTCLVYLVATLPAARAVQWFFPARSSTTLTGVEGTLWHGHATQLNVNGTRLGRVTWNLRAQGLLRARLAYAIRIAGNHAQLAGHTALTATGAVIVSDIHGTLALPTAAAMLDLPLAPANLSGQLELDLHTVVFDNGRPKNVDGTVRLVHLGTNWPQPHALGSYFATFTTAHDKIEGRIHDINGPIKMRARVISHAGRYQMHGTLQPRARADTTVRHALRYIGRTDNNGTTHFSAVGELAQR